MHIVKQCYWSVTSKLMNNPTGTTGVFLFVVGFSLVAGNALYAQTKFHPDPMWQTIDRTSTRSVIEQVAVTKQPVSVSKSVLTHRISLQNIPVPTASPDHIKKSNLVTSEMVRDFQDELGDLGLYNGKIDGIYGSGTRRAIVTYQKSAGLLPNGEASYELLAHIQASRAAVKHAKKAAEATRENLIIKETQIKISTPAPGEFDRSTILRIQKGLKVKFGETDIDVDGVFGSQTQNALMRFQKFFQLDESGKLDQATINKLMTAGIIEAI